MLAVVVWSRTLVVVRVKVYMPARTCYILSVGVSARLTPIATALARASGIEAPQPVVRLCWLGLADCASRLPFALVSVLYVDG